MALAAEAEETFEVISVASVGRNHTEHGTTTGHGLYIPRTHTDGGENGDGLFRGEEGDSNTWTQGAGVILSRSMTVCVPLFNSRPYISCHTLFSFQNPPLRLNAHFIYGGFKAIP